MPPVFRSSRIAAVLIAALGAVSTASAGPPLICHAFVTDAGARLLPWAASRDWHAPDPSYDAAGLIEDTLELLSADAPILERMENLRRATIYAAEQPGGTAESLLQAVLERTETAPADTRAAALASFDAGYLVEAYRQFGLIYGYRMLSANGRQVPMLTRELADVDGYALLQEALALAPELHAELDFASSLMTREPLATTHRIRAASATPPGSLLAQNLAIYLR
jgi:hypothetical protein